MNNICSIRFSHLLCFLVWLTGKGLALHAQEKTDAVQDRFTGYVQQTMQEKLYVHTDKNFYLAGEICWFKIYNVDAFFNRPLTVSKLAYVEVIGKNNKPVVQLKVPLEQASGNGSFQVPMALASGTYVLRAYTRWMKNFDAVYFFEKSITIVNTHKVLDSALLLNKNKYDLQVFPEGGNLVNGIESTIGFKISNRNGRGASGSIAILNERHDTIATANTLLFGMGRILFTPETTHQYTAVANIPGYGQAVQVLPATYDHGYVMHLARIDSQHLTITVQSNATNQATAPLYLFAHTRGSVKLALHGTPHNGSVNFSIDIARLGEGITHFTIFDAGRHPVCERLFFKKPVQLLRLSAVTDATTYGTRKKITVQITGAAQNALPVSADLSMAVYRVDSLNNEDDIDISSYCWLRSDLPGNIESASYYLKSQDQRAEVAADNLMLTQGWRRFKWEDVLRNTKPVFEFTPEYKGHIVTGKIINNNDGRPVRSVETYLSVAGTRTQVKSAFSDDSGIVKFEMNHFYGNGEIVVQTGGQEDGLRHVEITNPFAFTYSGNPMPSFSLDEAHAAVLLADHASIQVQNTFLGDKLKQALLPAFDTTPFYFKPDKTFLLDDYVRFTTLEEVLREYVPEVNVRKSNGKFYLPVFDNVRKEFFKVPPLTLLDGVPVLDADRIMRYDPLKIKKLEVVARMYFYGYMFFDGIVNFITYQGDMPGYELDPHAVVVDYETLQLQREFYAPVYATPEQAANRLPDFRTLLYWSPFLQTGKDGRQTIEFYTSDLRGRFAAVLQGISADGKTGSNTIYFTVKSALEK